MNPVDLNILPNYNSVIPKKDMRDLGTIKSKVENNKYDSPLDGVVADISQLSRNAIKYNGPQDPVAILSKNLEAEVIAEVNAMRKSLKRKGNEDPTPPGIGRVKSANGVVTKKIKTGHPPKNH